MNNWTIGKRLGAGFAGVIVIVLVLGTVIWTNSRSVSRNITAIVSDHIPLISALSEIRYQVTLLRVENFKYLLYTEAAQRAEAERAIAGGERRISELIGKCEQEMKPADQRALVAGLPPLFESYKNETVKLRQAKQQNQAAEVNALLMSAGKIGNELLKNIEQLDTSIDTAVTTAGRGVSDSLARSQTVLVTSEVLAVLASIGIVILISRSISTVLRRTIGEMSTGADQTAAAAGQVSASSQSLAEGASEQAAALEETSSSLEEMASMTKRNAENAEKATQLSRQARQAADTGAADMEQMHQAMAAIKASSDEVAKIIKTIDEVAFQTNILALNAAVEAARAGEAGMGFAVVADEVRSLAQRCAQSANETSEKIEAAISKTAQGVEISAKVTKGLQEIVTKVRQVDELVAEVASASREQNQGIGQVNTAVGQMDKVTQANAASAEESASASEELSAQAETVKAAIRQLQRLVGGSIELQVFSNGGQVSSAVPRAAAVPSAVPGEPGSAGKPPTTRKQGASPCRGHGQLAAVLPLRAKDQIPMGDDFRNF